MSAQTVVLLHGLGRTRLAMLPLAYHLRSEGFSTLNVGYFGPAGLDASVKRVRRSLKRLLEPGQPVHFVTHSMGGVVVRALLTADERPRWTPGRLVQLAPPNQGAWLANRVRQVPLLDQVQAFFDLGRLEDLPRRHRHRANDPPAFLPQLEGWEVGVIAGRSFGPWHQEVPSDGVVRVAETYLPEARDWILLEHFHTVIMNGRDTWANVVEFLNTGMFLVDADRLALDGQGGVVLRSRSPQPRDEVTHEG